MVLLAVRMVADVTETRNVIPVIPSLEFKTCLTIKSYVFTAKLVLQLSYLVRLFCFSNAFN